MRVPSPTAAGRRRALAGAAACVFALPSCFTVLLWGGSDYALVRPPHEHREPLDPSGVALDPGDDRQPFRLALCLPDAGGGQPWLLLEPMEYAPAVAHLATCLQRDRTAKGSIALELPERPDGQVLQGWVTVRSSAGTVADQPGVEIVDDALQVRARCLVRPAATLPATASRLPPDLGTAEYHCTDAHGYWIKRVLLTPVTLAVDAVTLPVQLLAVVILSF